MKTKLDRDQFTLSFGRAHIGRDGKGSGHRDGFRIQFYWPSLRIINTKKTDKPWSRDQKEIALMAGTSFRAVLEPGYWGIGGGILGFGIGMDYQKDENL